jgi:hypothetical protein
MAAKPLDVEQAVTLESAAKKLSTFGSSQPLAMRQAVENQYGRLYQKAVKRGEVRQIKKKYRTIR